MKKVKVRYSKTPPPGWPTEEEWVVIEKELAKQMPIQILSPNATPIDRIKYKLCEEFVRYLLNEKISQRELAIRLGIGEARVSEIIRYRYQRFTIDKLVKFLIIIKPTLKFKVA